MGLATIIHTQLYDCCTPEYAAASGTQLTGSITGNEIYEAANLIESIQVLDGGDVHYDAGECIELLQGFEVKGGTSFQTCWMGVGISRSI